MPESNSLPNIVSKARSWKFGVWTAVLYNAYSVKCAIRAWKEMT